MPNIVANKIYFYKQESGQENPETIAAEDVVAIVIYNRQSPGVKATFRYMPIKDATGSNKNRWVFQLAQGEYLTAFVGASEYSIGTNGEVSLLGTTQTIHYGSGRAATQIQPSFPVYMQKKGSTELTHVGLRGGISFEASNLRTGVIHYLSDDPSLCSYIRDKKLAYKNIRHIVSLYSPQRGNSPLRVDGKEVKVDNGLITGHLDKELIYNLEIGKTLSNRYTGEIGLGMRSSYFKFISYGADLGAALHKNVNEEKRIQNHLMNEVIKYGGWKQVPVLQEDLSNDLHFRVNTFLGLQLPMNFGKLYLVPAAHMSFGGLLGANYAVANYGPMFNIDMGFPLKNGSIFFVGGGYRYSIPLVSNEERDDKTFKDFDTYENRNSAFFRIGYKF